jgi:hypothetical protein
MGCPLVIGLKQDSENADRAISKGAAATKLMLLDS